MRVILAGSRTFDDFGLFKKSVLRTGLHITEVISGGARGADSLSILLAKELNVPHTTVIAEWDKFGKRAGILRNIEMGKLGEAAVVFPKKEKDGKLSKGSSHMIKVCKDKGLIENINLFVFPVS